MGEGERGRGEEGRQQRRRPIPQGKGTPPGVGGKGRRVCTQPRVPNFCVCAPPPCRRTPAVAPTSALPPAVVTPLEGSSGSTPARRRREERLEGSSLASESPLLSSTPPRTMTRAPLTCRPSVDACGTFTLLFGALRGRDYVATLPPPCLQYLSVAWSQRCAAAAPCRPAIVLQWCRCRGDEEQCQAGH